MSWNPYIATVGANIRRAVHRLHARVSEKWNFINPLERLRVVLYFRLCITIVTRNATRLLRQGDVLLELRHSRQPFDRARAVF